jgi:hypothetical protein
MSHEKFQACIDACNRCASECEHCATLCLREKEVQILAKCIELDHFCADMCRTAAAFMGRSDGHTIGFVNRFCNLCAEICDTCAEECEKFLYMEHCEKCAVACRRCADECRAMTYASVA